MPKFQKNMARYAPDQVIGPELWRHQTLDSMRNIVKQFKREFGTPIIACDSTSYWRRTYFPFYKSQRKAQRDAVAIDWKGAFNLLSELHNDLQNSFGYTVVLVAGAEADDIIATLVKQYAGSEPILIQSRDADFSQLHKFPCVEQYDQVTMKRFRHATPEEFLLNHILTGDREDGVPNVLSDDDALANPAKRQKPLRSPQQQSLYAELKNTGTVADPAILRNVIRNTKLIDLSHIPVDISDAILEKYHTAHQNRTRRVMDYCADHRLRNLLPHIGDF